MKMNKTTSIGEILEGFRINWPVGACSLMVDVKDYSGSCGRCGWSVEDHEYMHGEGEGFDELVERISELVKMVRQCREWMCNWVPDEEHRRRLEEIDRSLWGTAADAEEQEEQSDG